MIDAPSVYLEDSTTIIRASALGNCIRELVATRDGERLLPWSDNMERIFQAGRDREAEILEYVAGYLGMDVWGRGQMIEFPVPLPSSNPAVIRGHVDGRTAFYVIEAKLFGDSTYDLAVSKGIAAFPRYCWQLSCYMFALDARGMFAVGRRPADPGDRVTDFHLQEVPIAPRSIAQIDARARLIASAATLPDCDVEQFPCRVASCPSRDKPRSELADPALEALCAEDRRLARQEKEIRTRRGEISSRLKALLTPGRYTIGAYNATLVEKTSSRLMEAKLRELVPDLDAYYDRKTYLELRIMGREEEVAVDKP